MNEQASKSNNSNFTKKVAGVSAVVFGAVGIIGGPKGMVAGTRVSAASGRHESILT